MGDGMPTVESVNEFARLYDVDRFELGASFGLLAWQGGRREVWTDTVRGTGLVREAVERMSDRQAAAYGFYKASLH